MFFFGFFFSPTSCKAHLPLWKVAFGSEVTGGIMYDSFFLEFTHTEPSSQYEAFHVSQDNLLAL